ncbi:hypothetical protein ACI3PH_19555 [Lactococcus lactis]
MTKNFNNNKSRFKEGKHFFLLQGADLKEFKNNIQNLDVVGNRDLLLLKFFVIDAESVPYPSAIC